MKKTLGVMDRIMKALASFSVSYAFVIMIYVLISYFGVFDPINNKMAVRLMCICFVIAVIHFAMGFLEIKASAVWFLLYFGVVAAVVLFMGLFVYDFFKMNVSFFVCLAVMLVVVFAGTYLIAYFGDLKKIWEINEIIRQSRK